MDSDRLIKDIEMLCAVMSVSGFEYRAEAFIRDAYSDGFDEIISDRVGSCVLIKRCGRVSAPRILVDAHLDEVGMLVSDVCDGGFLRIVNVGGIDPAIMQASDVCVYGKEMLRGVVVSVPPHLRGDDKDKLPAVEELMVDVGVGYTKEELEAIAPIGTPVGFAPVYSLFGKDMRAGKSLDDKACCAIAARAVIDTPADALAGDVYMCMSAREETSRDGGISPVCFNIDPDYAMVIDVNLGNAPDAPERETVELGKGVSLTRSAATSRALTEAVADICRREELEFVYCAAPSSTGTNATSVNLVGRGIPVVDVGLPLRNMHTYNEVVSLKDCHTLYGLVRNYICSGELAERFAKEELI